MTELRLAAVQGLFVGDALSGPADLHRTVRDPWVRSVLWEQTAKLDACRVDAPLMPFGQQSSGGSALNPTDDAELFALACETIAAGGSFERWLQIAGGDEAILPVALRAAVVNARHGLLPPHTGNDNPARDDALCLPGAIACGLAFDVESAGQQAERLASFTHAGEALEAARVVARFVAATAAGASLSEALAEAAVRVHAPALAEALFDPAPVASGFAAVLQVGERYVRRTYSYCQRADDVLAAALVIVRGADSVESALLAALSIPRMGDVLPALVGALAGAALGWEKAAPPLAPLGGLWFPVLAGGTPESCLALLAEIAPTENSK